VIVAVIQMHLDTPAGAFDQGSHLSGRNVVLRPPRCDQFPVADAEENSSLVVRSHRVADRTAPGVTSSASRVSRRRLPSQEPPRPRFPHSPASPPSTSRASSGTSLPPDSRGEPPRRRPGTGRSSPHCRLRCRVRIQWLYRAAMRTQSDTKQRYANSPTAWSASSGGAMVLFCIHDATRSLMAQGVPLASQSSGHRREWSGGCDDERPAFRARTRP
jgi:hypothetical protein